MSLPKVLVGVVTYEGKDYIFNQFIENILNFSYPNFDVVIVDNSRGKKYYRHLTKKLKRTNVQVHHVKRGLTSREAQANSLNLIRDLLLEGEYDYFMSIESDLIPPRDIIERLLTHKTPSVGCLYNIGFSNSESEPPRYCVFSVQEKSNGKGLATINVPDHISKDWFGMGVIKVHGCGLGCTLIKTDLIEDTPFRFYISDNPDEPAKHADVLWYADVHAKGIDVFVDTDIVIPHFNSDWNLVKDI